MIAALLGPPARTVATAESCTGGLMAARLTDRGGSSAYALGGITAYSNEAKTALAGVPASLIEAHGAVSPEVASALADGAVERFGADVGIGITGIAGPGGGTRGEARGDGLPVPGGGRRGADRAHRAAPGRPGDGARADHHGRHAPAAPPADLIEPEPTDSRGGSRLRLFVALELPRAAVAALAAFREAEASEAWRPVRDEALHLTLAFLGHRPEGDVEVVRPVLREAAGPAPALRLGGALLLPQRRARVLCASVEDLDGELAALQARVSAGLASAGVFEPETRPFRPHATVARLRPRARPPRDAATAGPEPVAFAGEALTLFHSRPQRGGALYEALERVPLS